MLLEPAKKIKSLEEAISFYKNTSPICGIYSLFSPGHKELYVGMSMSLDHRFGSHIETYKWKHGDHPALHDFFDQVGIKNVHVAILFHDYAKEYNKQKLEIIESIFVEYYFRQGYKLLNNRFFHNDILKVFSDIEILQINESSEVENRFPNIYSTLEAHKLDAVKIIQCCCLDMVEYAGKRWSFKLDSQNRIGRNYREVYEKYSNRGRRA